MAKNKVQFQKVLSLQAFLSQFGSEDQCRNALARYLRRPKVIKYDHLVKYNHSHMAVNDRPVNVILTDYSCKS